MPRSLYIASTTLLLVMLLVVIPNIWFSGKNYCARMPVLSRKLFNWGVLVAWAVLIVLLATDGGKPPGMLLWGAAGRAAGHFVNPHALAVDARGEVYVLDAPSTPRVPSLLQQWHFAAQLATRISYRRGLAVDSARRVYVTDSRACRGPCLFSGRCEAR